MSLDVEQRFQQALARIQADKEKKWPEGYPEKARLIQEEFDRRHYGTKNPPSAQWEFAAQMATKLEVVIGKPEIHDPLGLKWKRYEEALETFNMETGRFPEAFNPRTGEKIDQKR